MKIEQAKTQLQAMIADGTTRVQAQGWLKFVGVKDKDAKDLLLELYGDNSRSTDRAQHKKAVEILIRGKKNEKKNKDIADELCKEMDWKPATAATLLSYHAHMVEYATQIIRERLASGELLLPVPDATADAPADNVPTDATADATVSTPRKGKGK
jgi:hypothetical protein